MGGHGARRRHTGRRPARLDGVKHRRGQPAHRGGGGPRFVQQRRRWQGSLPPDDRGQADPIGRDGFSPVRGDQCLPRPGHTEPRYLRRPRPRHRATAGGLLLHPACGVRSPVSNRRDTLLGAYSAVGPSYVGDGRTAVGTRVRGCRSFAGECGLPVTVAAGRVGEVVLHWSCVEPLRRDGPWVRRRSARRVARACPRAARVCRP